MAFPGVSEHGRNSGQEVLRAPTTPQVSTLLWVLTWVVVDRSVMALHNIIIYTMESRVPPLAAGKIQLNLHQVLNSIVNITPVNIIHAPASTPTHLKPRWMDGFLTKPPKPKWFALALHRYGCFHGNFHQISQQTLRQQHNYGLMSYHAPVTNNSTV